MISATIYGRLTRDPELTTPQNGGESYTRFSVACDTGRKDNNNNRTATFINITAFGKQGDVIRNYFKKGNRIVCHIRNMEVSTYINQNTNQPQASLNAVLNGVEFVETLAETQQQPVQPQAQAQPQAQPYRQQGYSQPYGQAPALVPAQPSQAPQQPQQQSFAGMAPVTLPWEA